MEATLTHTEMETIAKIVSEKLYTKFMTDGSQKELQKANENYTKQMIQFYLSENSVAYDVAKMIEPIFDKHLKKSRIIEEHLSAYLNTEHFKKLELKHIEQRAVQIRRELEENDND